MRPLPACRCGGSVVVRWNIVNGCWDALCDTCPAGFWGVTKVLAEVEWGRAMRESTYTLEAEPMRMGFEVSDIGTRR